MDVKLFLIAAAMILAGCPVQGASVFGIVHDLLQDNIAGRPVIHEETEWDFDPDVGKLRRVQFEALNGWQGRNLIDRLGYGNGAHGVTPKSNIRKPAVILPTLGTPVSANLHLRP